MMLPLLPLWGLRLLLRENKDDQLQSVKKLRSKYSHISNGLIRTREIVAELFQATVLTARERDDIQIFLSTPVRANEQLLNTLILKDSRAFECFLTALSNTDQKQIAEILIHEDEYLDTKHPLVIQRNYATLIDNLDVHSGLLLDRLYEASLLTGREMATINAKPTKHEKNETLLALVSKFSVTNFDTFLQALEKSNQEHVVSILTGKDYSIIESTAFGSTSVQSTLQGKHLETRTNSSSIPECQDDSNRTLLHPQDKNTRTTSKWIKPPSFDERKSFKALQTTFIKFPDELQTQLSLKVAALRQKTTLPSDANMDIFYHKIVRGFIHQRKSLNRPENFASQLEGQLKANISMLNEELGWHRNNKRHLDETIKTTATELDESRRHVDALARQLEQWQKENNDLRTERDGTVSELEKILEQERKVWAEEKELIRNQIQELQNGLSGSSKKCFNLEQELKLQRTENDRLKEQAQEYNRIIDAGREKMQVIEFTNQLEDERRAKNQLISQLFQDQRRLFDSMVSELKEKLEQERKVWAEEKEQLVNQMQELQKEFSGKLRFNLDPVLVQTIRTKAAEEKKKSINGLTILDKELFVVSDRTSEVEVYDSMKLSFSRRWNLKELIFPVDIGSCSRNKCLYIFHLERNYGQSSEILRVDPNGNLIKNWSTEGDWGSGLSVTDESNVILAVFHKNKLNEYSSDGQLIREMNLSSDEGFRWPTRSHPDILHPWHAIKLTSGHVVVSHGVYHDDLHRVCIVDGDGKLKKSFGGVRGSTNGQMTNPVYLAVDGNGFVLVVDRENIRVLLLDSDLEFKREILSKAKHGLRRPSRILLDQTNNRLFVADNEEDNGGRILIFEF